MNHNDTLMRLRKAAKLAMTDEVVIESAQEFLMNSGYFDEPEEAVNVVYLLETYTAKVVAIAGAYFTEAATSSEHIESLTKAAEEMMSNEMIADLEKMLGEL